MSLKKGAYLITFVAVYIVSILCQNTEISGLIEAIARVSYSDCVKRCDELRSCASLNYDRAAALCSLSSIVQTPLGKPGVYVYSKVVAGGTTDEVFCEDPQLNPLGTKRYGNFRSLGSKIKYTCEDGSNDVVSTCLEDGTWSNIEEFMCDSSEPRDSYNSVPVEHVAFWKIEETTDTIITVYAVCNDGFKRDATNATATYNIQTKTWTGVENICCDKFVDGDWQKIYSFPATNTTGYIYGDWFGGYGNTAYCQYRNSPYIDKWSSHGIAEVKLSIIKDSQEAAWAIFNGQGSTNGNWMTNSRLVNSSWPGLNNYAESDYLIAFHYADGYESKYYISRTDNEDAAVPRGWLNVRFSAMPDDTNGRRTIIYSTTTSLEVLDMENPDYTKVDLADRLEIWTKHVS